MVIDKTHVRLCPDVRRAFKTERLLIALGLKTRGHNYIKPSSFTVTRFERNQRKWPNMRPDWNQRKWPSRQTEVNGNGRVDRVMWTEMAESTDWGERKWPSRQSEVNGNGRADNLKSMEMIGQKLKAGRRKQVSAMACGSEVIKLCEAWKTYRLASVLAGSKPRTYNYRLYTSYK